MIPLRDDNPTRRTAVVTLLIIAVNVMVFVLVQPKGNSEAVIKIKQPSAIKGRVGEEAFLYWQAAIPCELMSLHPLDQRELAASLKGNDHACSLKGEGKSPEVFPAKQPLVSGLFSMFLHGGWAHLLGNMLFLWVFGNNVEDRWGRLRYLGFYVVAGFVALAAHVVASPNSTIPVVGASGAIAAVMGAYLVMFPRAKVLSLLAIIPIRVRAWLLIGVWFVMQFFTNPNSGVAWVAHVGGFVFGVLVAILWRRRRVDLSFPALARQRPSS